MTLAELTKSASCGQAASILIVYAVDIGGEFKEWYAMYIDAGGNAETVYRSGTHARQTLRSLIGFLMGRRTSAYDIYPEGTMGEFTETYSPRIVKAVGEWLVGHGHEGFESTCDLCGVHLPLFLLTPHHVGDKGMEPGALLCDVCRASETYWTLEYENDGAAERATYTTTENALAEELGAFAHESLIPMANVRPEGKWFSVMARATLFGRGVIVLNAKRTVSGG
jgi:hypothetical protein